MEVRCQAVPLWRVVRVVTTQNEASSIGLALKLKILFVDGWARFNFDVGKNVKSNRLKSSCFAKCVNIFPKSPPVNQSKILYG